METASSTSKLGQQSVKGIQPSVSKDLPPELIEKALCAPEKTLPIRIVCSTHPLQLLTCSHIFPKAHDFASIMVT
jgi:hypothetical protein